MKIQTPIETDELGHSDRDSVKENKRQKELKERFKWTFIRINPNKYDFTAFDGLSEIYRSFEEFKKREIKKTYKKRMKNWEKIMKNWRKKTKS